MSEASLHKAVCHWLKLRFPMIIFNSDLSGFRLTMGQSIQAKALRSSRAFPDLVIYHRSADGNYSALFLELKQAGTKLLKKDGMTYSTPHIAEQADMLERLEEQGYCAMFAIGIDEAMDIINGYLTEI